MTQRVINEANTGNPAGAERRIVVHYNDTVSKEEQQAAIQQALVFIQELVQAGYQNGPDLLYIDHNSHLENPRSVEAEFRQLIIEVSKHNGVAVAVISGLNWIYEGYVKGILLSHPEAKKVNAARHFAVVTTETDVEDKITQLRRKNLPAIPSQKSK